ncbi:MAG TPA: FAD-dependent oxidoreductase [Caulobacteraceae bacterium]|jgi:glycine oxidase
MNDLSGARVLVVGAGVLGLSVAVEAAARGARCTVFDPDAHDNASGVAAGMLAPAFESALDPTCTGRLALFRAARDLWPAFCERHGLPAPERAGAVWVDPARAATTSDVADALAREGAVFEHLSAGDLRRLTPGLAPHLSAAILTPEDWRIDPAPALAALAAGLTAHGGELVSATVAAASADGVQIGAETVGGDAVAICAGPSTGEFPAAAPELSVLRPIKGEILRFDGMDPRTGPTLRSPGGYLVPNPGGALAGATMDEGAGDRALTAAAALSLRAMAGALYPSLANAPATQRAAVRAATPDGLPLAGRSATGVWLAAGARRNGWLLAPLVGSIVADGLAGASPPPWAEALRPARFAA